MWLRNPGWWRKPLSCLAQSGSVVPGPRESTPWPPEELWLTGGHTGGRGRLLPGRAACELGFAGVRAGRASVDSPLGCGQAEISGIFVFVPVQGWRAWCLPRKGWRKQPTRAGQACELGVWKGCGRGTGLLCAGSEVVPREHGH